MYTYVVYRYVRKYEEKKKKRNVRTFKNVIRSTEIHSDKRKVNNKNLGTKGKYPSVATLEKNILYCLRKFLTMQNKKRTFQMKGVLITKIIWHCDPSYYTYYVDIFIKQTYPKLSLTSFLVLVFQAYNRTTSLM